MNPEGKLCKNGTYTFILDSAVPIGTEIGFSVGGGWPPGTQVINTPGITGGAAIIPLNCTKKTSLFVYDSTFLSLYRIFQKITMKFQYFYYFKRARIP